MRRNQLGYAMVSEATRSHFYPGVPMPQLTGAKYAEVVSTLERFDITVPVKQSGSLYHKDLPGLPALQGNTVFEHFESIARDQVGIYIDRADDFVRRWRGHQLPKTLCLVSGWTKYETTGAVSHLGDSLDCDTFIFDVETYVQGGNYPVMATAASPDAVYLWLSPEILNPRLPKNQWAQFDMVPLGGLNPDGTARLFFGHNCLPWDTEVYVKGAGWKALSSVQVGDSVVGYDSDTNTSIWTDVKEVVDGGLQELIEYRNSRNFFRATRDHRWPVFKRNGKFCYKTTDTLRYPYAKVVAAAPGLESDSGLSPDQAALLAWIWGDGERHAMSITQKKFVSEVQSLVDRLGLEYVRQERYDRWRITIPSFVACFGKRARDIDLVAEVEKMSKEACEAFLHAAWLAEGLQEERGRPHKTICQTKVRPHNVEFIDAIQLASVKLGKRTWRTPDEVRVSGNWGWTARTGNFGSIGMHPVGCLRTGTTNFLMRQNGFVTFTGNCGFDRVRCRESYYLHTPHVHSFDTLSMHVAVAGLASGQRANRSWRLSQKAKRAELSWYDDTPDWDDQGTINGLVDVYNFHVYEADRVFNPNAKPLEQADKEIRDLFVTAKSMDDLLADITDLAMYAIKDAIYTGDLVAKLWPKYRQSTPTNTALAGHLHLTSSVAVMDKDWYDWVAKCDKAYNEFVAESSAIMLEEATNWVNEFRTALQEDMKNLEAKIAENPHWQKSVTTGFANREEFDAFFDSLPVDFPWTKPGGLFRKRATKKNPIPERKFTPNSPLAISDWARALDVHLPGWAEHSIATWKNDPWKSQLGGKWGVSSYDTGVPWWAVDFFDLVEGSLKLREGAQVSTKGRLSHLLCRIQWEGQPIVHLKEKGWCRALRTSASVIKLTNVETGEEFEEKLEADVPDDFMPEWKRLPHAKGDGINVGGVMNKDYVDFAEEGRLSSVNPKANRVLEIAVAISYWIAKQKMIHGLYVRPALDDPSLLIAIPAIVPHGTVTRRVTEGCFMTLGKVKKKKMGTELKSKISTSGTNWKIVGGDFDAQEAMLCSIWGDMHGPQYMGGTPFSFQVTSGSKQDGTDIHSALATELEVDRDSIAKPCNFAFYYFGGAGAAGATIKKGRPNLTMDQCKKLGAKGVRKVRGTRDRMTGQFYGGVASEYFNYAYAKAEGRLDRDKWPSTPILGNRISQALRPSVVGNDFITGRGNWVTQSSSVDLLHAILVAQHWLKDYYKLQWRFLISVHDEVWSIASEKHALMANACWQIAHLFVMALVYERAQLWDIPLATAYFSGVAVDTRIRKSVKEKAITPSQSQDNLEGTEYSMEELESLGVFEKLVTRRQLVEKGLIK